jgi:tetratricopeptide (TPR) repeat protein
MGEAPLAKQLFTEARDLFSELGDAWNMALAEMNIANTNWFMGNDQEARANHEEARAMHEEARAMIERIIPVIRERGDRFWLTEAVTGLGQLEQLTGRLPAAREHYGESLQLALEAGTVSQVAMVLEPLANVDAAEGRHRRAVRLWAAAQAIKERVGGGAPQEIMQTVDPRPAAVAAIGEVAVAEAWEEGSKLTLEEAVAAALATDADEETHV